MAYFVERKVKGNIYCYKVESYWDKDKKQPRQRTVYLGPKENAQTKQIKKIAARLVSKNYGNIFFLEEISKSIGLYGILKDCYPDIYKEILLNSFYEIMGESKNYLLHHFQDGHYVEGVKKMFSSDVSSLHHTLGSDEQSKMEFIKKWIEKINPKHGIYYDITSFSSYSTKNEFVEWGYNRDGENLPQINLGMVCCQKTGLPFFYNVYPGSIVDVTTIMNFINYLKIYNLQDLFLIMDKGFFSVSNISGLIESDRRLSLIIPLPFSLKLSKELIADSSDIKNPQRMFQYNEEILFHKTVPAVIAGHAFNAHIFFNEKAEVDMRHLFFSKLLAYESKIRTDKLEDEEAFETCLNQEIPDGYKKYFQFDAAEKTVVRNETKINEYLLKSGFYILITNRENLQKEDVLAFYRDKDGVEKIFDTTKNELDTNRLRSHSKTAAEGRLFVKFIATIIYQQITKVMREKEMFKKFSVIELLKELSKIKRIAVPEIEPFTSECSKTQKDILAKFNIKNLT
jgi:transposase